MGWFGGLTYILIFQHWISKIVRLPIIHINLPHLSQRKQETTLLFWVLLILILLCYTFNFWHNWILSLNWSSVSFHNDVIFCVAFNFLLQFIITKSIRSFNSKSKDKSNSISPTFTKSVDPGLREMSFLSFVMNLILPF